MAAGIGSRFGKGIKQLLPVGPQGQILMDYSVNDALEAGFDKVVFIIRKDLEEDFRRLIGKRIEEKTEVAYVFQELDDLPDGFDPDLERTKPWGTGQAILCCRSIIQEPFAVINADDFYGKEPFVKLHAYLEEKVQPAVDKAQVTDIAMAGFRLGKTLSENGGVTRGICSVDAKGRLIGIHETKNIIRTAHGIAAKSEDGAERIIPEDTLVSMNFWGLQPDFLNLLEEGFRSFLSQKEKGNGKGEFLLPIFIDELLRAGRAHVSVLPTEESWFGVTYKEDRDAVSEALKRLTDQGVYPADL